METNSPPGSYVGRRLHDFMMQRVPAWRLRAGSLLDERRLVHFPERDDVEPALAPTVATRISASFGKFQRSSISALKWIPAIGEAVSF